MARVCADGRRAHGPAGTGAQLERWAAGGRSRSPRARQRPPLRSLGSSSAVSVTGVAGAAEPPAPGGAQLCSGAAEPAVPSSCTPSPSPAGPTRHLPGQSRRAAARGLPGTRSEDARPGGGFNFKPQAPVKLGKALCRAHDLLLI